MCNGFIGERCFYLINNFKNEKQSGETVRQHWLALG